MEKPDLELHPSRVNSPFLHIKFQYFSTDVTSSRAVAPRLIDVIMGL